MHGQRSRQDFAGKEFFCAKVRITGIGQWWERFGVGATFVLCRYRTGHDDQDNRGNQDLQQLIASPLPREHPQLFAGHVTCQQQCAERDDECRGADLDSSHR